MKKNENSNKLIPTGTFHGKTLCGDCVWLDLKKQDSSGEYYCRKVGKYKRIDLNTSCDYWTQK